MAVKGRIIRRRIISYILTFILMLCIMGISLIGMGKYSMFSERAVFHAYDKVGLFTKICSELKEEAYNIGIPYGIESNDLNGVFIRKNAMRDLMATLSADINEEKAVINTSYIKTKITRNIKEQYKGKLTDEQQKSLDEYINKVEKMYQKKMVIPCSEYIAKMINIFTKLFLIGIPVCVLIAILCMFYLVASRSKTYRGMRYIVYGVLGAGVTLLTLFAALISSGFIYKFNISDAYMRRFFTYYLGHEFLMQVIMGIILMVIGVILVFIISRKKFRN